MADKTLKTRISLKYDTLAKWQSSTLVLNAGEIAIATVPTDEGSTLQPVMFKVGDGSKTFSQLDWASAKAADVYGWAKQSTNDFVNTFLNLTMTDGTTMQSKLDAIFATDAELAKAIADLRAEIPTQLGVMSVKVTDDDIVVGTPETATTGDVTIDLKHKKYEKAGTTSDVNGDAITAGASVTIKVPTLKIDEYGHTEFNGETSHTITIPNEVAVGDGNITISAGDGLAEGGIFNVNQDSDATITLKHADTSSVANVTKADRTYVSGLTFDDFGHVTAVEVGTESVENTAHTHSDGIGVKLTGNGGVEGDVKIDLDIKFNETLVAKENGTKYLQILDKTDNSVIAEFAATEFIKDGVLKNVELKTGDDEHSVENGPYLVFTWNLDNVLGEDNDENADILWVPVKDLIDTYTADGTSLELLENNIFAIKTSGVTTDKIADGAVIEGKLANDAVTTNKIKNENVIKTKLSKEVQASLEKADTALQAADIEGKADKVADAIAGNFAGLDANGNLIDSEKKAADFATAAQGAKADTLAAGIRVETEGEYAPHISLETSSEYNPGNASISLDTADITIHADAALNLSSASELNLSTAGDIKLTTDDGSKALYNNKEIATVEQVGVTAITSNDTTENSPKPDSNVSGLKVTSTANEDGIGSTVNVEIDDTITFIFDCGGANN